jgi:hypothetical protein
MLVEHMHVQIAVAMVIVGQLNHVLLVHGIVGLAHHQIHIVAMVLVIMGKHVAHVLMIVGLVLPQIHIVVMGLVIAGKLVNFAKVIVVIALHIVGHVGQHMRYVQR